MMIMPVSAIKIMINLVLIDLKGPCPGDDFMFRQYPVGNSLLTLGRSVRSFLCGLMGCVDWQPLIVSKVFPNLSIIGDQIKTTTSHSLFFYEYFANQPRNTIKQCQKSGWVKDALRVYLVKVDKSGMLLFFKNFPNRLTITRSIREFDFDLTGEHCKITANL